MDVLTFVIVALLLATVFGIVVLCLRKDIKEFNIHFGLLNGFDFSGSFYSSQQPQKNE